MKFSIYQHHFPPPFILLLLLFFITPTSSSSDTTNTGTDLGGGIITRTPVHPQTLLSFDLRDMSQSILQNDYITARNIYTAGRNSILLDSNGNELPEKRSLASLSTRIAKEDLMEGEMTFLFQMYGLTGGSVANMERYYGYGDSFARASLDEEKGNLGVEAALVLNLWMYCAHLLWVAVKDCATVESGVNTELLGVDGDGGGSMVVDEFVGYWIGAGQVVGSEEGYALYALSQKAGNLFGKNTDRTESPVNTAIKSLYEETRALFSFSNACSPDSDTVGKLWVLANRMISQMSIPLIQMLIHSMKTNDVDRVRMYSHAIVPQMSSCRSSVFRRLRENLLERDYDDEKFLEILGDLQQMYDCMGITCADVGAYKDDAVGQCADIPINYPMAEYTPSTSVHQHAKIDLDINQIKLLLEFAKLSPSSLQTSKYLYLYGKNSVLYRQDPDLESYETRSLHSLSKSSVRSKSDFFPLFENFHNDKNYADTLIIQTLDGVGKWGKGSSAEQRREIVIKSIQYQVMYMFVLAMMEDAYVDCTNNDKSDNEGGVHSWDVVAAFVIGSLEGYEKGGSADFTDGALSWNLANKRCTQFDTVNGDGYAQVNAELEDLLYAGKGQLDSYACTNLRWTIDKIRKIMLVPIIQSVLRYAIKNEDQTTNTGDKNLAEGEAFTNALLPIVKSYKPDSAVVLQNNMIVEPGIIMVSQGPQKVADAFYRFLREIDVECTYVGEAGGVDVCRLFIEGDSSAAVPTGLSSWTGTLVWVLGAVASTFTLWLV